MHSNPDDSSKEPSKEPAPYSMEVQHSQVSARVPEKVGRGVFSTGAMALQSNHEFILDFVQGMAQPRQVVARVVLPPSVMPALINALRDNIKMYQDQFGPPPALKQQQQNPQQPPPTTEEVYAQFKLADDQLSGSYANAALIAHTQSEFCLDFITTFYPRSAVSCRVYLSAPQAPSLLNTLQQSYNQYRQKMSAPPPPEGPSELPPFPV